jgi:hypothetical protein
MKKFLTHFRIAVVSCLLLAGQTESFAQSCQLDGVALYAWLGDADESFDNSTSDDEDGDDWIGFVNRGTSPVDISGWKLYSDHNGTASPVFTFPANTTLSPGQKVFVIAEWDGGSIRPGWYSAGYNVGGEGMFEETSNNKAFAILENTAGQYITIHQQGANSEGAVLSSGTKVCNLNVTNLVPHDFDGCEAVVLNESTGTYSEHLDCNINSYPDTDGDGTPDITDTDDDNDGISDTQDKFPIDTDNDGTANALDPDDDGDGIADTAEQPGKQLDTDNDGMPNNTDTDDDGDSIPDTTEQGTLGPDGKYTLPDTDGDGLPDLADALDTDHDGVPDHIDKDDDNDGILDSVEGSADTDGDGVPNSRDLDSDNDGISDLQESGNPGAVNDTNNDGTIQNSESPVGANGVPLVLEAGTEAGTVPAPRDEDADGTPNYLDTTSDGTNRDIDSTPYAASDANHDGRVDSGTDSDGDGISDIVDKLPGTFGGIAKVEEGPDLTPILTMNQPDFTTANPTRSFQIDLYDVQPTPSSGLMTLYVIKPTPNFTMSFNSAGWSVTDQGGYYSLTSSATVPGSAAGPVSVSGSVTIGASVAKGVYNLQVVIADGSGSETDNTNNTANVKLNVNP